MKYSKAVKIAIEAMLRERQVYAFDANLAKRFGSTQSASKCAKKVTELNQAIAMLKIPRLL